VVLIGEIKWKRVRKIRHMPVNPDGKEVFTWPNSIK
jgi:hypothetical protein